MKMYFLSNYSISEEFISIIPRYMNESTFHAFSKILRNLQITVICEKDILYVRGIKGM